MFIKNSKSLIHKRVYFPATLDDLFGDADDISSDEEDKKGEGEREEGDEDKPQVGFYPNNIWLLLVVLLFSPHLLRLVFTLITFGCYSWFFCFHPTY